MEPKFCFVCGKKLTRCYPGNDPQNGPAGIRCFDGHETVEEHGHALAAKGRWDDVAHLDDGQMERVEQIQDRWSEHIHPGREELDDPTLRDVTRRLLERGIQEAEDEIRREDELEAMADSDIPF